MIEERAISEDIPAEMWDRLQKLERILAAGRTAYAANYPRTHLAAEARALLADDAERSAVESAVAGRVMAKRGSGGMTFADLQDPSGRIQLVARRDQLGEEEYGWFTELDLGDLVGVTGRVFRTRRGEISVEVGSFQLLSKALRPLPEKWHGLKDIEIRYRQRYLDLVANPEVREVFLKRSRIISGLRRHLDEAGFLEIEAPVLQDIPGGGHARPFRTHHNALDRDLYLRIALELHLKRLVVGGLERVYELGRVFRNEGLSPRHNPEFTMLECYQAFADYENVMRLTEGLIAAAAEEAGVPLQITYQGEEIDLRPPFRRARMVDLIREHTAIDVLAYPDPDRLHAALPPAEPELARTGGGWGVLVNELFETFVEPKLRQPTFVLDYPVEISPLARRRQDDDRFVERFELIVVGRELANAFTELTDPVDQRRRFEAQAAERAAGSEEAHPFDEDYLRALEHGLPPTGGLGIGVDRLVMLLTDQPSIRDVLLFPHLRS